MRKFEDRELASMAGSKSSRAGVPNKANQDVRKAFQLLIENNLDRLQMDLDALRPADRLRIILELARFVIPQLQSVSLSDLQDSETQGFGVITIKLEGNGNGKGKSKSKSNGSDDVISLKDDDDYENDI